VRCGSPVHDRCARPSGESGCPTCGALPQADPVARAVLSKPVAARLGWPSHTWNFLVAYYLLAWICGIRNGWIGEWPLFDLVFSVAMAIVIGWWAIADARYRGRPIPLLSRVWFFLLTGLVVPVYVINSRGWRGLGLVVLHGCGWYGAVFAAWYFGWWLLTATAH